MNITHFKYIYIVAIFCFFAVNLKAEDSNADSSVYKVSIEVGVGPSLVLNKMYSKKLEDINTFAMLRMMWKPDKILHIGIEADYLNLMNENKTDITTEFGKTDFNASMYCYPVNGVLSMQFWGIDLYAGAGIAFVKSSITAFNEESKGAIIAGSYIYGASYSKYYSDEFSIGLEAKGFFISSINKIATALILKINWDLYSY